MDVPPFPRRAETSGIFRPGQRLLEGRAAGAIDGIADFRRPRAPEPADAFWVVEGQVPCAVPLFVSGILDELLLPVGRIPGLHMEEVIGIDLTFQSELCRSFAGPPSGFVHGVGVIADLLPIQAAVGPPATERWFPPVSLPRPLSVAFARQDYRLVGQQSESRCPIPRSTLRIGCSRSRHVGQVSTSWPWPPPGSWSRQPVWRHTSWGPS
jgi:hypothetical protein